LLSTYRDGWGTDMKPMSDTTRAWLHGLTAAFVGAAASSLSTMLVAPETFNLTTMTGFRKLVLASGLSGVVSAAAYLKTSPLPQPDTLQRTSKTVTPEGAVTTTQTTATIQPKESQ
jgi:hypothetical protein